MCSNVHGEQQQSNIDAIIHIHTRSTSEIKSTTKSEDLLRCAGTGYHVCRNRRGEQATGGRVGNTGGRTINCGAIARPMMLVPAYQSFRIDVQVLASVSIIHVTTAKHLRHSWYGMVLGNPQSQGHHHH